jgi:hypothetical protein
MRDEDLFRSHAVAKRATAQALLVSVDGEDYWLPQSAIHEDSEVWKAGDEGELVISQWWAEKKGMC